MSWSARYKVVEGKWSLKHEPGNLKPEYHADQHRAAYAAAQMLIESGAFGDAGGSYDVTLTGHGNPGHVPLSGWSDDFVSINIAQRREE